MSRATTMALTMPMRRAINRPTPITMVWLMALMVRMALLTGWRQPQSGLVNYTIVDTDSDTTPDYRDLDSDNDTISDLVEGGSDAVDADRNGVADRPDRDSDGIVNSADANDEGDSNDFGDATTPALPDSDRDSLPNFRDRDSDGNGLLDIVNAGNGTLDLDQNGMVDNKG